MNLKSNRIMEPNSCILKKELTDRVLIVAEEFRNHAPGGIAAVLQYYRPHFETFKYLPTFKSRKFLDKLLYVGTSYFRLGWKLAVDRQIRVVHIHTAADGSFRQNARLLHIARRSGRKVILHIHASRFKDYYNEADQKGKNWILSTLLAADLLVVLSQSWKDWFESIGVPAVQIEILHNITASPVLREIPDNGRTNFLFLGEIGERKGVFDIIQAISAHKNVLKDEILFQIGGNRHEKELREAIHESTLDNFVKFAGFVFGDKKIEMLNQADVFILPSRNEGLPISILEAMSYGCAIISTPVGGIPEVVTDNGILVEPGNIEEIYEAMLRLTDRKLVKEMGARSREAVQSYLPNAVMSHLGQIYSNLAGKTT